MLIDCLKQLGKGVSSVDRTELEKSFKEHQGKGLSEYDASMAALGDFHKGLFDDINELRRSVRLQSAEYKPLSKATTPKAAPTEAAPPEVITPEAAPPTSQAQPPGAVPTAEGTEGAPAEKERSFPQTLAAATYQPGTDLTYEPTTRTATRGEAERIVRERGVDGALSDLRDDKIPPGAVRTGLGVHLSGLLQTEARAAEAKGDKATAVVKLAQSVEASTLAARNLTTAGQEVEAAKQAQQYTPEGVMLEAARVAEKRGVPLTEKEQKQAADIGKEHADTDKHIANLEQKVKELEKAQGPRTTTKAATPRTKIQSFIDRLDTREQEARARLLARRQQAGAEITGARGQRGSAVNPASVALDIADWSIIGASKIAKGGLNFAKWSQEMIDDMGESIRPHLNDVFAKSYAEVKDQRQQYRQESQERIARAALGEGATDTDVSDYIKNRMAKGAERRAAASDLGKQYKQLTTPQLSEGAAALARGLSREQWMKEMGAKHPDADLNELFKQSYQELRESKVKPDISEELKATRAQLNYERGRQRQGRMETDRYFQYLNRTGSQRRMDALNTLVRDSLLTIRGALRIGIGMGGRQAMKVSQRMIEAGLDATQSAITGGPRTVVMPNPASFIRNVSSFAERAPRAVRAAVTGGTSVEMPQHYYLPPTNNPVVNMTVGFMSRLLYAPKEAIISSWAYPEALDNQSRTFALNDMRDGLIKRGEMAERAQDYRQGRLDLNGPSNQRLSDSLARQAADYEQKKGLITPTMKEERLQQLKKSSSELLNSLALQETDKAVFRQPNWLAQKTRKAFGVFGEGGKSAQAGLLPFVTRPFNNVGEMLTGYTPLEATARVGKGVVTKVQARQAITPEMKAAIDSKFGPAQVKLMNEAIAKGAAAWVPVAIGFTLAKAGLMTSGYTQDRNVENIKTALGEKGRGAHIVYGGHTFNVGAIPVVGWLMGIGSTLAIDGPSKVPYAVRDMILEHPLMRTIQQGGDIVEGLREGSTGAQLTKVAGETAARLVPAPVKVASEASDTKERDTRGVEGPIRAALPGLRQTLPVRRDVLGREQDKSHFSFLDPFNTGTALNSPGLREMVRMGVGIGQQRQGKTETLKDFRQRQLDSSKALQTQADDMVRSQDYRSASRAVKQQRLKDIRASRARQ